MPDGHNNHLALNWYAIYVVRRSLKGCSCPQTEICFNMTLLRHIDQQMILPYIPNLSAESCNKNKNCPTSKYLSGWKRICLPFIQLWSGSHSCVKPMPCSLQLVLLVRCNLPMTKSAGMSKTKYNSETTITQAKCTKKWDKICELCQGRLPQTKYVPRLLNFYF